MKTCRTLLSVSLLTLSFSLSAEIVLERLGRIGGFDAISTEATGMSADGSIIAGNAQYFDNGGVIVLNEAFRWEDGVISGIGWSIAYEESNAADISDDGTVIVGTSRGAYRWVNGNWTDLSSKGVATGVSGDGTITVGHHPYETTLGTAAVYWLNGTRHELPRLSGGDPVAQALAISGNGQVIAGQTTSSLGTLACRWENGNVQPLGDLPSTIAPPVPTAIDFDGSTIVGTNQTETATHAFLWTGVMSQLENLPAETIESAAMGLSADGSVIVGHCQTNTGQEAVMWLASEDYAPTSLNAYLDFKKYNRQGWSLISANAVSDDGRIIAGAARSPQGHIEAYRLFLETEREWAGYPISDDGSSVDTGDFIGWIDITHAPWLWSYSLGGKFIYGPEESVTESGGWFYIINTGQ